MKKSIFFLILICLFLFTWSILVAAQTPSRTATLPTPSSSAACTPCPIYYNITVNDVFGYPITGASVSVASSTLITDNVGKCQFNFANGIPNLSGCMHGSSIVQASAPGYVSTSVLSGVNCPGYNISLRLEPVGGYTPTPTPAVPVANFQIGKAAYVYQDKSSSISLYLGMNTYVAVAAYDLNLSFDPGLLALDTAVGTNGVEAGSYGFFTTAVAGTGTIRVTGQSATGIGPTVTAAGNTILEMIRIHFKPLKGGSSELRLSFNSLTSVDNAAMDNYILSETPLKIMGTGDVNFDLKIDIIDALMTAQYAVGIWDDVTYYQEVADVNGDTNINIVDALIIAQYYVGLIPRLPL